MRTIFSLFLINLTIATHAQGSKSSNLGQLKIFFAENEPCVENFYCYDYSIDLVNDELKIEMKLYNFIGESGSKIKTLTETTLFHIPLGKIKEVDYFPYDSEFIVISTFNSVIRKNKNGNDEMVDYLVVDFDKHSLTKQTKMEFISKLDLLMEK